MKVTQLIIVAIIVFALIRAYKSSQQESSEMGTLTSLPPSVQQAVLAMNDSYKASFYSEFAQKRKKSSVGYLLFILFGFHYIYFGKIGLQFAYWLTFGGLGIWTLVDLFRMPSITRSANEQIARTTLQTLQVGTSFNTFPPSES